MNTYAKGSRLQREYARILEAQGYAIEVTKWQRFGRKDFFNAFDIIAVNKVEVLAVQVRSNRTGDISAVKAFKCPKNFRKIIAIKVDRKGWRTKEV